MSNFQNKQSIDLSDPEFKVKRLFAFRANMRNKLVKLEIRKRMLLEQARLNMMKKLSDES